MTQLDLHSTDGYRLVPRLTKFWDTLRHFETLWDIKFKNWFKMRQNEGRIGQELVSSMASLRLGRSNPSVCGSKPDEVGPLGPWGHEVSDGVIGSSMVIIYCGYLMMFRCIFYHMFRRFRLQIIKIHLCHCEKQLKGILPDWVFLLSSLATMLVTFSTRHAHTNDV